MNRRLLLQSFAAALLMRASIAPAQFVAGAAPKAPSVDDLQRNWKSLLAKDAKVASDLTPVVKSDAQWRQVLDPAAYSVLRHVAMLLAEALGGSRRKPGFPRVNAQLRAAKPAAKIVAPRESWLDRLDTWFWRQEQKEREAWLARSRDVFELERRIAALDREGISRYY